MEQSFPTKLQCLCGSTVVLYASTDEYGKSYKYSMGCKRCDIWACTDNKSWGIGDEESQRKDRRDAINTLAAEWKTKIEEAKKMGKNVTPNPCPNCGTAPAVGDARDSPSVICSSCGRSADAGTLEIAKTKWNMGMVQNIGAKKESGKTFAKNQDKGLTAWDVGYMLGRASGYPGEPAALTEGPDYAVRPGVQVYSDTGLTKVDDPTIKAWNEKLRQEALAVDRLSKLTPAMTGSQKPGLIIGTPEWMRPYSDRKNPKQRATPPRPPKVDASRPRRKFDFSKA